jgi:hypothetical protein
MDHRRLLRHTTKKSYQPVSRILFPPKCMRRIDSRGWPSFIWPLYYYRDLAAYPPALLPRGNIGRAALDRRYTWHFSMQGLPAPAVTRRRRGLLPHVFILTLPFAPPPPRTSPLRRDKREGKGSYFLWHWLWMLSHPPALNRYIALCCPDFPPPAKTASDDPVGSKGKDKKNARIAQRYPAKRHHKRGRSRPGRASCIIFHIEKRSP